MSDTALTELAGVADCPTESAYAWALDYDDEPTQQFTAHRVTDAALACSLVLIGVAGVVALLGIRGVFHVPAIVEPTPVAVTTAVPSTPAAPPPVTLTAAPLPTVTVPAPPAKTVQAPLETIEPTMQPPVYIPTPMPVDYDQREIYNLQAHGFTVSDAAAVVAQARQACGMLQGGTTPQMVVDHFTGGPFNTTPSDASAFVAITMGTYPNCP
jgi:hypothetical protein